MPVGYPYLESDGFTIGPNQMAFPMPHRGQESLRRGVSRSTLVPLSHGSRPTLLNQRVDGAAAGYPRFAQKERRERTT